MSTFTEENASPLSELQRSSQPTAPDAELRPDGLAVGDFVRHALESLTATQARDAGGRYAADNIGAGKTLARSERFWTFVEPAIQAVEASVFTQLGLTPETVPETQRGIVEALAEIRVFRRSMRIRLTEGPTAGPITAKGKTRALYTAYLGAVDREMKLAQLLGLERRSKPITNPRDYIAGKVDA